MQRVDAIGDGIFLMIHLCLDALSVFEFEGEKLLVTRREKAKSHSMFLIDISKLLKMLTKHQSQTIYSAEEIN